MVGHAIVDIQQLIHLGMSNLTKPGCKIASPSESRRRSGSGPEYQTSPPASLSPIANEITKTTSMAISQRRLWTSRWPQLRRIEDGWPIDIGCTSDAGSRLDPEFIKSPVKCGAAHAQRLGHLGYVSGIMLQATQDHCALHFVHGHAAGSRD